MCEFTGGPFAGCGGAPTAGHDVSAACSGPAEKVCLINEVKQVSWRCSSPEVHVGEGLLFVENNL